MTRPGETGRGKGKLFIRMDSGDEFNLAGGLQAGQPTPGLVLTHPWTSSYAEWRVSPPLGEQQYQMITQCMGNTKVVHRHGRQFSALSNPEAEPVVLFEGHLYSIQWRDIQRMCFLCIEGSRRQSIALIGQGPEDASRKAGPFSLSMSRGRRLPRGGKCSWHRVSLATQGCTHPDDQTKGCSSRVA